MSDRNRDGRGRTPGSRPPRDAARDSFDRLERRYQDAEQGGRQDRQGGGFGGGNGGGRSGGPGNRGPRNDRNDRNDRSNRRQPQTPEQSVPGYAARAAAVKLLNDVLIMGRPLEGQLDRHLEGLSGSDRGLARALVAGVLRNLPGLDRLIDSATSNPLPHDARARHALRVALAGRLLLDTPAHAAISTVLPMLEGGPRRLVHGVLSTLFREDAKLPTALLPDPWDIRWGASWGQDEVAAAARRLAEIPPTDLSLKDPSKTAEWAEKLGGISLMPGHVRLAGSQSVERLPGFEAGEWWVQDYAASLPARLLGDLAGKDVLDLCAAPGGKTLQLLAAGANVTALDISGPRIRRLRANLHRMGLQANVIDADALHWEPEQKFDAILLDAPCSATGTFRRHPDLLYSKSDLDLTRLVALQTQLIARAASWLKPGGQLVYAVCSLEPAEGEQMIVPEGLEPVAVPTDADWAQALHAAGVVSGNAIRTLPTTLEADGGVDGFYMAHFKAR